MCLSFSSAIGVLCMCFKYMHGSSINIAFEKTACNLEARMRLVILPIGLLADGL